MKTITKLVSWGLFIISAGLFLLAVYSAARGQLLDLTAFEIRGLEPGALIVAGVVTITWINGGLMLHVRAIESPLEWKVTRLLTILAFFVDVAIMIALILGFHVPPLLPLFVAMGHAGAHVFIWIAASGETEKRPGGLLSQEYQSPEERLGEVLRQLTEANQQIALLQQSAEMERRQREIAERREERTLTAPRQLSAPVSANVRQTPPANNDPEQIKERIRALVLASPDMPKAEMARQLGIARSTLYAYWPADTPNGHHKEAVN